MTAKMEGEKRRYAVYKMEGRVGEWLVFSFSIISPGLYAPDDPDVYRGNTDTCRESLTLK